MSTQVSPFGFLAIDKPTGLTSHDVVAKVRRGTGIRRIGHAGTLDPMATGALILCIGAATRLSEYVMNSNKNYRATVRLGIETDTYDADGRTVAVQAADGLSGEAIRRALLAFQGEIDQIPPMYSAIKQGGKRLYKLAWEGKEVERASRRVWMEVSVVRLAIPDVTLSITCSPGTYIRSLAHDLGAALGVGGHLIELRRVSSGAFSDERGDLVGWQTLINAMTDHTWERYLFDERRAIPHIPELRLTEQQTDDVLHGRRFPRTENLELCRAYATTGEFIAILESEGEVWKPAKVFLPDAL